MIDICVRMRKKPPALVWICREIPRHIFVNLLLQVYANSPIRSNNLVRAYAGFGRNISVRIRNTDVSGIITDGMVRSLDGSGHQFLQKLLARRQNFL